MALLFFLCALHVFAGGGIYADYVAFVDEHRDLDLKAVFKFYGFGAACGGVAFVRRRSLRDFVFHFYRKLYVDDFFSEFIRDNFCIWF